MPLRKRLSLIAGAAVAVSVAVAVVLCYWVVRGQLLGQVDNELRAQASLVQAGDLRALVGGEGDFPRLPGGADGNFPGLSASAGGAAPYDQIVATNGAVLFQNQGGLSLPDDSTTRNVAAGTLSNAFEDATVKGIHVRIYSFHVDLTFNDGQTLSVAAQLARPLQQVDNVLSNLRVILFLLFVGGIAVAALLGRIAASRVLAPLAEVTRTAQLIGETDDLSRRLAVHADDEVGQLANRFNEMLERLEQSREALDESVRAQRQLVADASHELRTPVTSLRTNVEVLLAGGQLDDDDRERLLADMVEQSEELSALVSDLIELARGDLPPSSTEDVRLDRVVEESLARARRDAPDVEFIAELAPVIVEGAPERLGRAVNNLVDNAARHTSPGSPVEVTVDRDGLRVRDHGSGISEKDLPHIFDRFYRGENARGRQGSGLGLAIVRQAALQHGGSVSATNALDGGAVFTLRLPTVAAAGGSFDDEQDADAGALAHRL